MRDIFTQLKKAQNVQMTSKERADIRATLERISTGASAPHEISSYRRPSPYAQVSPLSMFGMLTRAAVFVVVGFVVGGTSVSFASLKSAPGDAFYPIKTAFVEKVSDAFAFSADAKARAQARHVATRVAEITELKARGTINDPIVAALATASLTTSIENYKTQLAAETTTTRSATTKQVALATIEQLKTIAPEQRAVSPEASTQSAPAMMAKSTLKVSAPTPTTDVSVSTFAASDARVMDKTPVQSASPAAATMMMGAALPEPVQTVSPLDALILQSVADLETIVGTTGENGQDELPSVSQPQSPIKTVAPQQTSTETIQQPIQQPTQPVEQTTATPPVSGTPKNQLEQPTTTLIRQSRGR